MDNTAVQDIRISVVIPAYNAGDYIARTVQSVLSQTSPPDEIIVIDDGSADDTAAVVRSLGDRIQLIRQENAGASAARNAGIQAAKGNWIAFLDGDDEWIPQKLELQINHLQKHPDLVWSMSNYYTCFCDPNHTLKIYDQNRSTVLLAGREYYNDYFDSYRNGTCGYTSTMLIQKKVLIESGLFRPGQPRMNDEDMWFRIAYRYPKVGYITRPLAVYHQGAPDSIVKKHNRPEIVIELIQRHLVLAEQQDRLDAFRPVARAITKMWIHWSWEDRRAFQIRLLLRELGFLLPVWYKTALYTLTVFPGLTLALMPLLRKINKVLKIPL